MNGIVHLISSSVGRKIIMGITGLFLCLFLVVHLGGNLLLLKNDGGVAFNAYAEFMATTPLIRLAEIILFLGFLIHIVDGISLALKNRASRPERYRMNEAPASSSWFSRHMPLTGIVVFVFLVIHLNSFFVKHRFLDPGNETMYETVVNSFQSGWGGFYWAFYVVCMVFIGFHLRHGFRTAFLSLGLSHRRFSALLDTLAVLFSIIVPAGFAMIPIYFYFVKP
ncbi:MAG: succinate dehydrogenase cytochrome b subunit [Acidobacteriota bacterium]|nr:succinate dehydrogenase cytochrome b subunit [Blastocatellia bacterium]MDW8239741.1 succinate dehydrogenase cytochrome b subunit [Acidobacteriota bacterium]